MLGKVVGLDVAELLDRRVVGWLGGLRQELSLRELRCRRCILLLSLWRKCGKVVMTERLRVSMRVPLRLAHVMYVVSAQIQLILLIVQLWLDITERRINAIMIGELMAKIKGAMAILKARKHCMRVMEEVN